MGQLMQGNFANEIRPSGMVEIGLNAAIASMSTEQPMVLTVRPEDTGTDDWDALPYGPFTPRNHRTLEIGLRDWVREQSGLGLGYVEQLYTFGDRGRHAQPDEQGPHVVSIGYLALTRWQKDELRHGSSWQSWYKYFPWEDWRDGRPEIIDQVILPRLQEWANKAQSSELRAAPLSAHERLAICFGDGKIGWDEEKALERYELLYESGLLPESRRDNRKSAEQWSELPDLGRPMHHDHRRIVATAIGRLRAKIKYRPVIFELMDEKFTLYEMQKTVEGIMGAHLHKQNFRRLVENAGLVEQTGEVRTHTGGRPAKLFRFRRETVLERPAPGVRISPSSI